MNVDSTRDPRLAKDVQKESSKLSSRPRILSVSSLGNKPAAENVGSFTESMVKSKPAFERIPLPSGILQVNIARQPGSVSSSGQAARLIASQTQPCLASDEAALYNAVYAGDTDEVCRILSLPNPPNLNKAIEPRYLALAAKRGFADIAGLLLRHGADVNAKSIQTESTALMAAAAAGHIMTQIVLLQWGANPDATNLKSDTALLRAIRRGHVPNVLLLLAYGANPIPCSSVRSTHFLLPLQLARHLCQQEMQNALINTNRNFDTYLTNLVRSSLPVGTFLVDPGHPTSMQSITPRSLSFIPVQIISNTNVTAPLQLTFNTPPHYSEYFSSFGEGLALDELILLYVACVDLQDGLVIPPRSKQATPVYTCAYFNGSRTPCPDLSLLKNYATSSISPSSPIDVDESPGFRVFVLGSRLNKGGLNSLSLETPAKRDQTRSKVHGPTHETDQESSLFEKLLFGIYRVRIGMGALSDAAVLQTDFCPEEPTVKIFSEH